MVLLPVFGGFDSIARGVNDGRACNLEASYGAIVGVVDTVAYCLGFIPHLADEPAMMPSARA